MTVNTPSDGPLHPEVLEASPAEAPNGETITSPTKLIRIASMVRSLLDEARRAPLDDAGRRLLAEIHSKALNELKEVLSDELREELADVSQPFESATPTDSELRVVQAQLVGWLEGLFHGIQATLYTQQQLAQRQVEDMRGGRGALGEGAVPTSGRPDGLPGAYL